MTIILFFIIISVLIVAHELGHFLIAKWAGIKVEEFGLGYPPKAKKLFTWKGTDFTLNWLPFGGFVKIFGENPSDEDARIQDPSSFVSKNRGVQALVLIAGVTANFVLAWLLMSLGFMVGLPASTSSGLSVTNAHTVITEVVPASPAEEAGMKAGDEITSIVRGDTQADLAPDQAAAFISALPTSLTFTLLRGDREITMTVTPAPGIVEGKPAVGIAMDSVGLAKLSPPHALWLGLTNTARLAQETVASLYEFLKNIFVGHADFSQVAGPVGLVGLVGDARALGFRYLISFTALISLNLAVLNLLPIPALDGGRLLFVIIEAIRRKPISAKVFNGVNNIGFGLLLLLMAIITVRDVIHLL